MSPGKKLRTFDDLLRVVRALAYEFKTDTVFIVGSQAILASMPDAPEAARESPEIDAFPQNAKIWEVEEAERTRDSVRPIASEHIDGLFGEDRCLLKRDGGAGATVRSVAEAHEAVGRFARFDDAMGIDLEWTDAGHRRISIRRTDVHLHQRAGRNDHRTALAFERQFPFRSAIERADHRLQPQNLFKEHDTRLLVGLEEAAPEILTFEEMPRRHDNEFARGRHARRAVGQALG
jgi:hypothetical protein